MQKVISPSYTRGYPLVAERGEGAIIQDVDGNRFLDFNAGIAVVATGHCHPRVVEAIQQQAERAASTCPAPISITKSWWRSPRSSPQIAPGDVPRRVSFGNSGAEAIEGAIKLARYHTGREKLIAFFGSFHGRTMGALSLTARKAVQRARLRAADARRGARAVSELLPLPVRPGRPIAAPSSACSTSKRRCSRPSRPPTRRPRSSSSRSRAKAATSCRRQNSSTSSRASPAQHGILLIADEVQSGMGRTGKMLASEHFDLVPDISRVAKGIASGLPLGATVARADLMNWPPGAHASTFGGNPVACAAALVTIELLEEELMDNAARMGALPEGPHARLAGPLPASWATCAAWA